MSTITVPLTPELEQFIEEQMKENFNSKAELVRQALKSYREEIAVQDLIKSRQEVKEGKVLRGDLRELIKKI